MTLCNIWHAKSVCGPHAARVPVFGPRCSRQQAFPTWGRKETSSESFNRGA